MPGKNPLVSIITVSLNAEKYIQTAIQSILSQSYQNIEYIIVDGGSSDNTIEIIKRFEDKIALWISEPDNGISDAFNKGIRLSHGDIIGLVNADDWLQQEAVERIVEAFVRFEADVICGGVKFWEKEEDVIDSYPDLEIFERETSIHHAGIFVKKSVYDKEGVYDTTYKYAMDYEFLLRVKKRGVRLIAVNEILSNRRLEGASYQNRIKALKETRRARKNYFSAANVWFVYYYVWLKDSAGRILKGTLLKPFYIQYWKRKNKKLIRNSEK